LFKYSRIPAALLMAAVLIFSAALMLVPAASLADIGASVSGSSITGKVIDAATGLPLGGVYLETSGPTFANTTTNSAGQFSLTGLQPGRYSLLAKLQGYESTLSEEFLVAAGYSLPLTLTLQRQSGSASTPRVLARTTVTASRSLQKASVYYQSVSGNALQAQGMTRAADAIRRLPAIDNTSSDTATFGDDVTLSIRGIGNLETVTLFDGHPAALGINAFNWDISPSYGLRGINVVYGAGASDLYGVDAIAGVVDMQTLEPSRTQSINFTQGWGTFDKLTSIFQATGTAADKWGYVIALGSNGLNGPVKNTIFNQPAAAYDPSATDPAVKALGVYTVNSNIANRGELFKLKYGFNANTFLTAVATGNYWYDNKTGIGDGDFLPTDTAIARANQNLANYTPPGNVGTISAINPPDCGAGTFLGVATGGNAYGYGVDGLTPDGGTTCVTPQQWTSINAGYQGAGPAWQAFTLSDYQLRFGTTMGRNTVAINGYSDLYTQTYDRTFHLPASLTANSCDPVIAAAQGTSCAGPNPPLNNCPCVLVPTPFWQNTHVNNAGLVASDSMVWDNNEIGFGTYYDNTVLKIYTNGVYNPSNTPISHETSVFFRDQYHPLSSPRVALVLQGGPNDVYRLAWGEVSTQPSLDTVGSPFAIGNLGGLGTNISCNQLNSSGSGGNPNLKPEFGRDTEFSWGHRLGLDSTVQLSLYSESIYNQLYSQEVQATHYSPSFFGTTDYLAPGSPLVPFANAVASFCGITQAQALPLLGIDSTLNIGTGLAQGFEVQGHQRFGSRFYMDYDYAANSSVPISVPVNILSQNFALIPASQLPGVPLHKYNFAFDYTFGHGIEARSETYFVSANNPKNLPSYNYTNFIFTVPTGKFGTANIVVNNAFQQNAFYEGMIGHGYPLALNPQFASQEDFSPLIGNQATEAFGLTFRTLEVLYSFKVR
jgi:hypothetical protein